MALEDCSSRSDNLGALPFLDALDFGLLLDLPDFGAALGIDDGAALDVGLVLGWVDGAAEIEG